MPTFLVMSFPPGQKDGRARLVDGVDAKYAATQGLEGQDVYVVAEDKARLWRDRRTRDEVPDAERTPPQP